jgi:tetratricopeptide (TPR) repeat protein
MFRLVALSLLGLLFLFPAWAQLLLPDSLSRYNQKPRNPAYVDELNLLANQYLKLNPYASRRIALHTAEVAKQLGYTKGYARALTVTGNSFWYEGVYDLAQNYYLLAARQYQNIHDSIGLAQTYNNLGEVFKRMHDYQRALDFLHRSLELKKKDTATRALTLYNIGELHNMMGNYALAEKYFNEALTYALQNNDQRTVAYSYWGFAVSDLNRKKYNEALDYFNRAERLFRMLGENRLHIQMYQDLADVYINLRQFSQAENYLNLASLLSTTVKVPDLVVANMYKRARLDSAQGNYLKALRHLYQHTQMKDSVFNLIKAEQMTRLQLAYETETRERENQELRAANQQWQAQVRFQRLIITLIVTGLVLTSVLTWILLRQRKQILKSNRELVDKNAEIERQKHLLEQQALAVAQLNEELMALNKSLEQRIEERTHQLSVQNQKLMDYTFFIAHKLRAPVSSILGLINLLDYGLEKDAHAIVKHMRSCSEQLDILTRQISKNLESGIIE